MSQSTAKEEVDRFKPPTNTLGIHQLFPKEASDQQPSVDIVAVHGLGGNSYATWTTGDTLWLRDLLPSLFDNPRILTFGYDARAFLSPFDRSRSTGRAFTFAESLLSDLDDWRISPSAKRRPLIFIGHSLGGIVIKEALHYAHARLASYGDILESTKAIVFFGTPHQGSESAKWATLLGNIGQVVRLRSTRVTADLQTWSEPLVELTAMFCELPSKYKLDITTYIETLPIHGVKVVLEGSARMSIPEEKARTLEADHVSICKFTEKDENWSTVKRRIEAIAQKIGVEAIAERTGKTLPQFPSVPQRGRTGDRVLAGQDTSSAPLSGVNNTEPYQNLMERLAALRRNE